MHMRHVILLCVWLTVFFVHEGTPVYFSQPEVTMQIMWNRTMYVTELVALLEPDESGEVIYSGFLTTAKQHCPSVKVNSTGHIYLEASPGLVAKPEKGCRYSIRAELNGKVGMMERKTSNTTLLIKFIEKTEGCGDLYEEQLCFGGFSKLSLQVMENSDSIRITRLETHNETECSSGKLKFSLDPTTDTGVFFLESSPDYTSSWLGIRGDLDREAVSSYDFNIICSFVGKKGIIRQMALPGTLTVLDQDDNPPYIPGNASTAVVYIPLHSGKNTYVKGERLEPKNGYQELSFFDADSVDVNRFEFEVVNDTKQLLRISLPSVYGIPNQERPNSTYGILKADLLGTEVSPWDGYYCVLLIVKDITLAQDRGNPNISFTLCLHFGKEPIPVRAPLAPENMECGPRCIGLISLGFIAIVACGAGVCYCVNQRTSTKRKSRLPKAPVMINANGVLTTYGGGNGSIISAAELEYMGPGPEASILGTQVEYFAVDTKWEVPRRALMLEGVLGEGEFGRVLKAKFQNPNDTSGKIIDVAVKMLKDTEPASGRSCRQEFMAEFSLLKQVDHHNVIKLLGACTTGDGPCYIIMEFAEFGSLRSFLRKCRRIEAIPNGSPVNGEVGKHSGGTHHDKACDQRYTVTPKEILGFSWQIARGMAYLSEMKMVHRDLAARNVLLATGKVCKISDFGLTRDVYVDDAYKKKSKDRVPVKWLAPECLADELYTTKSDVWAYGILLWELANMGASPYPGIPSEQLYSLLKSGYRMPQPSNCSFQFYGLMRQCWADEPANRPTFRQLVSGLGRLLEDGIDYIQLNIPSVSNPAYDFHCVEDPPNPPASVIASITMGLPSNVTYQPFLTLQTTVPQTSTSSNASSRTRDDTENSGESLRLIDHESSTCACDSSQAEDGDSEYNNTFLHTYINNEPNKEESQTSISSQETIVPYSGSGYESPIKLRPVAY